MNLMVTVIKCRCTEHATTNWTSQIGSLTKYKTGCIQCNSNLKWQTSTICRFYYTFHPATVLWNSNSESSSTFFSQKDQISHQSSNKKLPVKTKYEVDTNLRTPRCHHHLAIEIPIADCLLSSYFCRPRGRPSPDTGPRGALGGTRARPRFGWLELGILGSWVDEAWKMIEPPKGLLEVSLFVVSLLWVSLESVLHHSNNHEVGLWFEGKRSMNSNGKKLDVPDALFSFKQVGNQWWYDLIAYCPPPETVKQYEYES